MRPILRASLFVLTAVLAAVPAGARHSQSALPSTLSEHNFVNVDLTSPAPAPPASGVVRLGVTLLDAASLVRDGDTVRFEALSISKTIGHYMSGNQEVGPPEGIVVFNTQRYQASCGWRTQRNIFTPVAPYIPGERFQPFALQPQFLQDAFLAPFSQFTTALDRTCEGRSLNTAKGFTSVAAAVDAWKDNFSALPTAVPRIVGRPPAAPSIEVAPSARFRAIATDRSNGNTLFLNLSSVIRDGQSATGQSLALLGPNAQRFSGEYAAVVALRNVQYDCAARTMTVTVQADWDRDERFAGETLAAFAPRSAKEASVIETEIETACGTVPPPAGADYSSIQEAWHAIRDSWPPSWLESWLPCLWNHASPDSTNAYVAHWTGASDAQLFRPPEAEMQPLSVACGIPREYADLAFVKLRYYATERAALSRLAGRDLDDAKILAAWRGQGWTERLKLI